MTAARHMQFVRSRCLPLLAACLTLAFLLPTGVGRADTGGQTGGQPIAGAAVSSHAVRHAGAVSARAVQQQLVALRYLPSSAVTGRWDYRTSQALMAFQAWQGLQRDGQIGPRTLAALRTAKVPVPRPSSAVREVEVYRSLGVTLLVDHGRVVRAVHSSSGKPGFTTPAGTYHVYLKSTRHWSTQYYVWLPYASFFNRGIAFHGYIDVPNYPASHGCIRIPLPDAAQVYAFAGIGTQVVVY